MISRNKIGVIKHPSQGKEKKVLCCCSAGILRSPTMANVLHQKFGYNTRSCGLIEEFALIYASDTLLLWSDEIVVAEYWMVDSIKEKLTESKIIICLDIPDLYNWNDKDLQSDIITRYENYKLEDDQI